jgi:hypothetical protein
MNRSQVRFSREYAPTFFRFMQIRFSVLQKGYFWQFVGLLLFFGVPILITLIGGCDPLEDCDTTLPGPWGELAGVSLVFTSLLGIGFYWVGAAHIAISAAHSIHKLLAIGTPLLLIWLLVALNG